MRTPLSLLVAAVAAGLLPYARFVHREESHARPVTRRRLNAELRDTQRAPAPRRLGLSANELRARILDALNIGSFVDGIGSRPLVATVRERHDGAFFAEEHLLLADGDVSVGATVLVPKDGVGVHPAVVGLHGHRDDAAAFVHRYMGTELARAGYVVIVPWSRAMDCGPEEEEVSLRLLRDGFTLMGLRVDEALVAIRYLRERPDVDRARIGILGHSGGSSTASLVVRVTDWVAADVSDHVVDYRDLCDGRVHCETVPALFPLSADINDPGTLTIPHLDVPYGFADLSTRRRIRTFLALSLHHHPEPASEP